MYSNASFCRTFFPACCFSVFCICFSRNLPPVFLFCTFCDVLYLHIVPDEPMKVSRLYKVASQGYIEGLGWLKTILLYVDGLK